MLLSRGEGDDREKAADLLAHAVDIARELGMTRLLEKVADVQARAQAARSSGATSATSPIRARLDIVRGDAGARVNRANDGGDVNDRFEKEF